MVKMNLTTAVIVLLLYAYVFWRGAPVPAVKRRLSLRWRLIIPFALFILFYLGGFGRYTPEWLAILAISFLLILAVDIVTGFGFFVRKYAGQIRGITLAIGLLYCALALVQGMRPPVVREYEVYLKDLPAELDGTVVAAVSDLHVDPLTKPEWFESRVKQIHEMQPDIILLLGDIIDTRRDNRAAMLKILGSLSAPMGVWAVLGNHEYEFGKNRGFERNVEAFDKAGIKLLRNDWAEVRPGFVLAGVDYTGLRDNAEQNVEYFHQALDGRPNGATILISHAPIRAEQAERTGVELMLSGHTHGGQLWPLNYWARYMFPLFCGRYEVGAMTVIVTRGAGTWGARMRLWRRGEMLRITLRSK
ncbi:MAG: metallophosphoesterase [Candidatus Glassbacteria bacterium]